MQRRDLFKAAPAAILIGALPGASLAAYWDTPIAKAYAEWKAYRDWLETETDITTSDDEFDALVDRRHDMEKALFGLPSRDLRDATLKLMAFTDCGADFSDDGFGTGQRLLRELGSFAVTMNGGAA